MRGSVNGETCKSFSSMRYYADSFFHERLRHVPGCRALRRILQTGPDVCRTCIARLRAWGFLRLTGDLSHPSSPRSSTRVARGRAACRHGAMGEMKQGPSTPRTRVPSALQDRKFAFLASFRLSLAQAQMTIPSSEQGWMAPKSAPTSPRGRSTSSSCGPRLASRIPQPNKWRLFWNDAQSATSRKQGSGRPAILGNPSPRLRPKLGECWHRPLPGLSVLQEPDRTMPTELPKRLVAAGKRWLKRQGFAVAASELATTGCAVQAVIHAQGERAMPRVPPTAISAPTNTEPSDPAQPYVA